MKKLLTLSLIGVFAMILAACGGGATATPEATQAPAATQAPQAAAQPTPEATQAPAATRAPQAAATEGQKITIQHAHIGRTSATYDAMVEFAQRVLDRTNGQVEIEVTGFPELGIEGPDTMRLIRDGTLDMVEVYAGYVSGDWPMIEMTELVGLYPDAETKLEVFEAIRDEEIRIIRERFNGQVIVYTFYDDQLIFSKKPLRTLEDFEGMKIRVHSTSLSDLVNNLGAESQFIPFAEVYAALDRGIVEAGFAGGRGTVGQKWYEITDYLHGPLNSNTHGLITINLDKWNEIPADFQQIILEEGQKTTEQIIGMLPLWDQEGIDLNLQGDGNAGMEFIEFSPEIAAAIRQTAIDIILPNWVERAGGPDTEAVQLFNELIGPIIDVRVNPDGSASATGMAKTETKLVTEGQKITIQHAHIGRTSATYDAMVEFAQRVLDRTNGQVEIEVTGFPELGIEGPDTMRLIRDGTLDMVEVYAGYVSGDWPMIEMTELVGLYPDAETKLEVFEAIRDEEIRIIRERFNGQVIVYTFYDDQLIFSKKPLRTLEDFEGMKIRVHSTSLSDLVNNLGAESQFIPFAEVYAALDRGIVEAGFAGGRGTVGQKWYEITDYLHGPLNSNTHGLITINLDKWNEIPADLQQIILEEGQKTTEQIIGMLPLWDQEGIDLNLQGDGNAGMEFIEFSPEIAAAIRQTAIDIILPNWVERAGGADTEAVQLFNELIGPIIDVRVNPDGSASAIR